LSKDLTRCRDTKSLGAKGDRGLWQISHSLRPNQQNKGQSHNLCPELGRIRQSTLG